MPPAAGVDIQHPLSRAGHYVAFLYGAHRETVMSMHADRVPGFPADNPGKQFVRRLIPLMTLLASLSLAPDARAVSVLWTLEDVAFDDGGTAAGTFAYDADLDAFSTIAITTTAGSSAGGGTVNALLAGDPLSAALVPRQGDLTGATLLQLLFQAPLTNAGGVVALVDPFFAPNSSSEGSCSNASCSSAKFARFMVSGNVVGMPVPVPAAGGLLTAGLAVLGARVRRRTRRT
jgi:hypothetical protein